MRSVSVVVLALVMMTFGATAARALPGVHQVMIVSQGEPPATYPRYVHYFKTIQSAVEATKPSDTVLIAPGVYDEEVKVTGAHSGIYIRGMNRNEVIIDGQNKVVPGGRNGIEVFKASKVWIENLTVRNFDRESLNGAGGNEIWWNGGEGSAKIGAHGWYGDYLTAYDTGLDGAYGIFTSNETEGEWNHIYASGFNDSGMYLGACPECKARINDATMEDNALGYSGSNSGGNLTIENSRIVNNSAGIAPNSENPGDGPPPQNGACNPAPPYRPHHKVLPTFTSTEIERCTIIRNNYIAENNNLTTPANSSAAASPWGVGVELPGDYADLVEHNTIVGNANNGFLGFEYPNPFPITEQTIFFALSGDKVANNEFIGNGTSGKAYAGDVTMAGGVFTESTNNCVSGNSFTAATHPENIEETWGCQNKTTPSPNLGFGAIEYLVELQGESQGRGEGVPQPAPPAQPTMPNPCEGVRTNPLCP